MSAIPTRPAPSRPVVGPSVRVTALPEDLPEYAGWKGSTMASLLNPLHMAVDELASDEARPALYRAPVTEIAVLICEDQSHLEEVEAELRRLGATWERIGVGRTVFVGDGYMWRAEWVEEE